MRTVAGDAKCAVERREASLVSLEPSPGERSEAALRQLEALLKAALSLADELDQPVVAAHVSQAMSALDGPGGEPE